MGSETFSEALMSERRRSSVVLLLITNQNYERCFCAAILTLNFVRLRHSELAALGRDMSCGSATRPQRTPHVAAAVDKATPAAGPCGLARTKDISRPKAAGSEVAETNKI